MHRPTALPRPTAVLAAVVLPLVLASSVLAAPAAGPAPDRSGRSADISAGELSDIIKAGSGTDAILDVTGYFLPDGSGATYMPRDPVRLLDTRTGNGLTNRFTSGTPRSVQITGRGGIPSEAVAITANVTVTQQTSAGYVSVGPTMTASPATSTLNFPRGDNRANGLTVALDPDGKVAAVFRGSSGSTTHLVLDVTGYFLPDGSGATYVPRDPVRLLDTRTGNGLPARMLASALPRSVQVTGRADIPGSAVAITGNVTITQQTSAGYVSVGPTMTGSPATSTLNFPRGDNRANGLTVALDSGGKVAAVFRGSKSPNYPSYDSRYHNEWEMIVKIREVGVAYPDIVNVFTVGKSHQGRYVWAAKVSDNVLTDENEPEVLFDALHHAREHLTIEQILDQFDLMTSRYATDSRIRSLVDSREIWFIFALNPDGWAFDLTGSPYRGWRKNRQPNSGTTAVGTDLNRNYDYRWACCGGSSGNKSAWNYRGTKPFSAPEARIMRDFVRSRVIGGKQQIRTHVTLHTNGELILYPYGYTYTNVPSDMTLDDHRTFVAMAKAMAAKNGYKAQQSSDLYVTDGDQIDWMYGRHKIFSFTFELYPPETVAKPTDHEPPDEVIAAQTARNREALLYLIEMANCPYAAIGKASTYC